MNHYHYTECGLPEVHLVNGFRFEESAYGETLSIDDVEGLHRVIGRRLALDAASLGGSEVRFLRREMGLAQTELARLFGVGETSVRGWENDRTPVGRAADRLLRLLFLDATGKGHKVRELLERLAGSGQAAPLLLERREMGWVCVEPAEGRTLG